MPDLSGGTPRAANLIAELDGQRYFVQQTQDARAWDVSRVPAQDADAVREYHWPLTSFHEGGGFTYDGLPYTYDTADGWDGSTPGKLRTWARHAKGASTLASGTNYRGWAVNYLGNVIPVTSSLYILRGSISGRYTVNATAGVDWVLATSSSPFGANNVVAGRPQQFKGILYVPIIKSTTDVPQRFYQLTIPGAPDTWTQGPANKVAIAFRRWKNLLARGGANAGTEYNLVETVSGDPMTAGDWSGTTAIGDPGVPITDLAVIGAGAGDLVVTKRNGLFSMDENLYTVDDLPELVHSYDLFNGTYTEKSGGKLIMPHRAGLIRWDQNSGGYRYIGPEQEGALEADTSTPWGRATGVTPYGKYLYVCYYDELNTRGTIVSFEPSRGGRGPLIPHVIHATTSGWFEGGTIVQSGTKNFLCVIRVSSDGTTVSPWVYQVPIAGLTPANDPNITHARDDCNFYTSRLASPGREVQKSWRTVEFWTEMAAADLSNTPGLQVWASVDGASFVQLLDSSGAAATIKANGFQRVYFPKTSAAVGHYCQLRYTIPAKTGGQTDVDVTIRDTTLRGELHPLMTNAITTQFKLTYGEVEDKTTPRRTVQKQKADLQALADPTSAAVAFKDIWGNTGYAKVTNVTFKEQVFKGDSEPTLVATVNLRERPYG